MSKVMISIVVQLDENDILFFSANFTCFHNWCVSSDQGYFCNLPTPFQFLSEILAGICLPKVYSGGGWGLPIFGPEGAVIENFW